MMGLPNFRTVKLPEGAFFLGNSPATNCKIHGHLMGISWELASGKR